MRTHHKIYQCLAIIYFDTFTETTSQGGKLNTVDSYDVGIVDAYVNGSVFIFHSE